VPGYRTHDLLTVATAAALVPAYYALAPRPDGISAAILAGACLLSGLLFSPDLDTASQPRRRWGHASPLWWLYERAVPHRNWLSHSPIAGPLLRLGYFLLVSYGLVWAALWAVKEWVLPLDRNAMLRGWRAELLAFSHGHPAWVLMGLLGFFCGALAHTLADCVWSALRFRRRRRRR
jgi:uncharacterized metal-binding protein